MTPNITRLDKETLHRFSLPSALIEAIRNKKVSTHTKNITNVDGDDDDDDDVDDLDISEVDSSSTNDEEDIVGDDDTNKKEKEEEQHQQQKKNKKKKVQFHPNVLLRRVPKLIDLDRENDDNDMVISLNDGNDDGDDEGGKSLHCRTRQSKFWYTKQELITIKLDNHTTVDEFMKTSYRNRACRRSIMNHKNNGGRYYNGCHVNPNNLLCWDTTTTTTNTANVNHDNNDNDNNDNTTLNDEMRGLEFLTYHGHCYRKQIQDAARTAVLLEQASQRRRQSNVVGVVGGGSTIDTDMIALVYYNFTKRSQHDAHMVGLQDERYVVLLQNEQQPTMTTVQSSGGNSVKSTKDLSLSISTTSAHHEVETEESKHASKMSVKTTTATTTTQTTPTTKTTPTKLSSPIINGGSGGPHHHSNTVTEFQTMVSTPTKKTFIRLL